MRAPRVSSRAARSAAWPSRSRRGVMAQQQVRGRQRAGAARSGDDVQPVRHEPGGGEDRASPAEAGRARRRCPPTSATRSSTTSAASAAARSTCTPAARPTSPARSRRRCTATCISLVEGGYSRAGDPRRVRRDVRRARADGAEARGIQLGRATWCPFAAIGAGAVALVTVLRRHAASHGGRVRATLRAPGHVQRGARRRTSWRGSTRAIRRDD